MNKVSITKVNEFIYRGPRPKDIRQLRAQGIKRIIRLQSGAEEALTDSPYEAQCAVAADVYGIEVINIPCSNILPPGVREVALATMLMSDEIKTYIHCHSGVDRTGFVVEAYLMTYEGKSYDDACHDFARKRHWWFFWWKKALKRWSR